MKGDIHKNYIKNFDINLLQCKFLGKGHNGAVYLLPNNKVIKICFSEKSCRQEYLILRRIKNNKYFPKVYGMCGNYMIRDYVEGKPLNKHIKKEGLSREVAINIIKLLEEFKHLKFAKEDIRCKDIMIKEDNSLMVIDPKKCYTKERKFPRHLSKGLDKLQALDFFLEVLKEERPDLHKRWYDKIMKYKEEREKNFE